jgi:hypothetical protein
MAQRVVLHAGLMKSGTSYLQERLFLNRDRLVERGVLVPGPARRDQALAVQDALGRHAAAPRSRGKWAELIDEIRRHDGAAVISMEFLGPVAPDRIGGIVQAFDAPVDVVLTVRDLGRVVPAMWQERLKNGGTTGWREYVDGLAGEDQTARGFWWQQGAARIVRNWAGAVGPERVTVVTLPLPGAEPGQLWSRFCAAADIAGEGCDEVPPANASLDVGSAVVLRAVNQVLAERGEVDSDFQLMLKFRLAKQVMAARTDGRPIGFEPSPWLRERAASIVAKIQASGVRVVGDLAELTPLVVPGADPEEVDATEALGAAVDALAGITADYFLRVSARGTDDRP